MATRQVVLDTETTGFFPELGDRIVEVGCVEMLDRQPSGRVLHLYVNPQRESHDDALRVHGLTKQFLADKPLFGEVAPQLLEFVAGGELIMHNAAFDVGFFDMELSRLGLPCLASGAAAVVDSLHLARQLFPGRPNSLDMLCRRLGVDASARTVHGALLDAGLLAQVYVAMTQGQHELILAGPESGATPDDAMDLGALDLPVIAPTEHEMLAHDKLIQQIRSAARPRV